ncbi:hypothetical protein EV128_12137 [Rhizobium azibense]|nr:hypothetical protein EV128_12137 [Rhizobium azibense]
MRFILRRAPLLNVILMRVLKKRAVTLYVGMKHFL